MKVTALIRAGRPDDIPSVWGLIRELAIYERAENEMLITEEILLRDGFGDNPLYSLHVAELDGAIVGIAICYIRYSTWKGPVLYLEDIIVQKPFRGRGIGRQLFCTVMQEAVERSCFSLHWQVLDWNEPAIRFYEIFGADRSGEWLNMRLTASRMKSLLNEEQA